MSDIKCDLCDKTYKTDKTLQNHKAKMHANSAPAQAQPAQAQPAQAQPAQKQPAQKQPAQKQPAQKQSAKSTPTKSTPTKSTPTKSTPTKSAQPQQAGGRATSAQQGGPQSGPQQTQNDNGPTRHYIITGVSRKNAQEMAAAGPPVRPPDTFESLRNDIDELRMLVYALVRTHYIQTLTENSRMEQESSSDSDGCGEKCGDTECTCE